jgi:hypothetical protein
MVFAEAPPVITCVASSTCLVSIITVSLAATETVVAKLVPANPIVKVPALAAVLVIEILVTTAVVLAGTVYSVVAVFVVAAPRNKVLGVAIIGKLSFF